jgi:Ni,Fe-hydrogenase III large subunit
MALESLAGCEISERAGSLRALLLERERVANHLGDLGALGNDAAFAFGLAQFSRLREDWLRLSKEAFGHRLMMDCVVPGGVASDIDGVVADRLSRQCDVIEREVLELRQVYDEHAGLQDRFMTTGRVTPELAARLGLTGLAGRASAQAADLRCDQAWPPYDQLASAHRDARDGDVAARVGVRFDEVLESLRLLRLLLARLGAGATQNATAAAEQAAFGAGWVEGWRGEVFVALEWDGERGANHPPLPRPRSLLAELAGARTRGHRQHRSRLSADQQVLQPQLLGTRPLMWRILRQIARHGIRSEAAPECSDALRVQGERFSTNCWPFSARR